MSKQNAVEVRCPEAACRTRLDPRDLPRDWPKSHWDLLTGFCEEMIYGD